jgi:hypothetical protein
VLSNTELQWLLCAIILNYQSISDFRKQRPSGLKNLFKLFVSFLKDTDLIRCKIIAIDGTKSRADSSKAISIKRKFGRRHFTVLVDKSYQNGRKLQCIKYHYH